MIRIPGGWPFLVAGALFLLTGVPNPANASLIDGDSVTCSSSSADIGCPSATATIGPAEEFTLTFLGGPTWVVDIGGPSDVIAITAIADAQIAGPLAVLTLGDLDSSAGEIVGISNVIVQPPLSGLDATDVTFTSTSVSINFGSTSWAVDDADQGAVIIFLSFGTPVPVPVPASLLVLAATSVGIGAAHVWRRRQVR